MSDVFDLSRRRFLGAAAMSIAAVQFSMAARAKTQTETVRLPKEGRLPSLGGATGWLNSQPLISDGLRGKVVLVDFWTYTCINWRRTFPYIRAWSEKYRAHGLVVIGVHTPEFPFEHQVDNVRWAINDMKIEYPIAVDSKYGIWHAFNNEYWPAVYIVDSQGQIRYHQFGEGDYDRSEFVIQQLLVESGASGFDRGPAAIQASGPEVGADWDDLKSPESYVGYKHADNFASPGGAVLDRSRAYNLPVQMKLNHWALEREWIVREDAIATDHENSRLAYQFHARDLHLVMGPKTPGQSLRYRVLLDGKEPGAAHGTDVDENGNGVIAEPRLYQLIRQPKPIVDRKFEIEFLDGGVNVFDFTFG